jgi:sterol desaturase/sphingolipid hydroxylase (fatty acid hydroxylase superfamily)
MDMGRRVLAWSLWPVALSVQIATVVVAGSFSPESVGRTAGLTTVIVLLTLAEIEQVLPYRRDWSVRGDPDVWRDVAHAVLYAGIGGTVAQILFVYGLAAGLSRLGLPGGLAIWPAGSSLVGQALTVVVVGDLLEYWYHRLAHAVPWLWSLHAVHHMPVRLHALKGPRHHLLYYLGRGLCVWTPLVILGDPPSMVTWQFVAVVLAGALAHANIAFKIPTAIHRVLVTPEFHRLHHAADVRQGNSNYATVFPVWDMMFGTHTDPMVAEARQLGIPDDPIPHRFLSELLSPVTLIRLGARSANSGSRTASPRSDGETHG